MKKNLFIDNLKWTLKLYSLTLVIPLIPTVFYFILLILGIDTEKNVFDFLLSYFFTGHFLSIIAIRWHLLILFFCYLFVIVEK